MNVWLVSLSRLKGAAANGRFIPENRLNACCNGILLRKIGSRGKLCGPKTGVMGQICTHTVGRCLPALFFNRRLAARCFIRDGKFTGTAVSRCTKRDVAVLNTVISSTFWKTSG